MPPLSAKYWQEEWLLRAFAISGSHQVPAAAAEQIMGGSSIGSGPSVLLPAANMKQRTATSFFVDCQQKTLLNTLSDMVAIPSMSCGRLKKHFVNRKTMEIMPTDRNCDKIYFILDRMAKRWFKCCDKSNGMVFRKSDFHCTEVSPSAWIPQMKDKRIQPFEMERAIECFRTRPQDFWNCDGAACPHMMEQCVIMGDRGGASKWAVKDASTPGVAVYMLRTPLELLTLPLDGLGQSFGSCDADAAQERALVVQLSRQGDNELTRCQWWRQPQHRRDSLWPRGRGCCSRSAHFL